MFWLMELDLLSLKGRAVCGSLCGSSMYLGSPSGPSSVRHLYFHSCFKVALSARLHCRQPLTCPGNHCYASVALYHPALLAEACWVGVCVDLSLAPHLCPLCRGDFCGLPSAPGAHPAVLRGSCALVSASWARPLRHGLVGTCLGSLGPFSASQACVRLSGLSGPILCVTGLCALVWAPRAHPLRHGLVRACLGSPGPSSASPPCGHLSGLPGPILCITGLCALVCACLGSPGPSSASRACVHLSGLPGLPGPILCIARLVGTCLSSRCPASASWACVRLSGLPGSSLCVTGLCVLVWVPCAYPQHRRAGEHLSQLTGPTLYITGFNFYI